MNKKILLIVHPHLTIPGGAGKVILELGRRLAKHRRIIIVAMRINAEYISEYPEIEFLSLNGPITSQMSFWLMLPYWRRKVNKAINGYLTAKDTQGLTVLANVFPANWLALGYKRIRPTTNVIWYCHEPSAFIHNKRWRNSINNYFMRFIANFCSPLLSVIDKQVTGYADIILSNSLFTSDSIKKIYNKSSIVIYPGVDTEIFCPRNLVTKDYILGVGKLTKFKNFDILIEAFSMIKDRKIRLKIVGDGEEKNNLTELVAKLGINDSVDFIASTTDMKKLSLIYTNAKIFVLCSKEEPFGIVPIEAMSSETVVIADNSGGPKEIIDNGENGILINNMDKTRLATCIDNVLSNTRKATSLAKNARIKVVQNFTWEKSSSNLEQYL